MLEVELSIFAICFTNLKALPSDVEFILIIYLFKLSYSIGHFHKQISDDTRREQ